HDEERLVVRIAIGDPVTEPEDETRLLHLELLLDATRARRWRDRRRDRLERLGRLAIDAELALDDRAHGVLVDVARDVDDHGNRRHPSLVALPQRLRRDRVQILDAALLVEAERLLAAHLLDEPMSRVGGLVIDDRLDRSPKRILLLRDPFRPKALVLDVRIAEELAQELDPGDEEPVGRGKEAIVDDLEPIARHVPLAHLEDLGRDRRAVEAFEVAVDRLHGRQPSSAPPEDERQERARGHRLVEVRGEIDLAEDGLQLAVRVDGEADAAGKLVGAESWRRRY